VPTSLVPVTLRRENRGRDQAPTPFTFTVRTAAGVAGRRRGIRDGFSLRPGPSGAPAPGSRAPGPGGLPSSLHRTARRPTPPRRRASDARGDRWDRLALVAARVLLGSRRHRLSPPHGRWRLHSTCCSRLCWSQRWRGRMDSASVGAWRTSSSAAFAGATIGCFRRFGVPCRGAHRHSNLLGVRAHPATTVARTTFDLLHFSLAPANAARLGLPSPLLLHATVIWTVVATIRARRSSGVCPRRASRRGDASRGSWDCCWRVGGSRIYRVYPAKSRRCLCSLRWAPPARPPPWSLACARERAGRRRPSAWRRLPGAARAGRGDLSVTSRLYDPGKEALIAGEYGPQARSTRRLADRLRNASTKSIACDAGRIYAGGRISRHRRPIARSPSGPGRSEHVPAHVRRRALSQGRPARQPLCVNTPDARPFYQTACWWLGSLR